MKKHADNFVLIGLIVFAFGFVAGTVFEIWYLIDNMNEMELDVIGNPYEIAYTVNIILSIVVAALFVVLSIVSLVRRRKDKPAGIVEIFLLVTSSMAVWEIVGNLISALTQPLYYQEILPDDYIWDLFKFNFVYTGNCVQIVGFILLILGAAGMLLRKKDVSVVEEAVEEASYEETC